jgi:hypothetical protein
MIVGRYEGIDDTIVQSLYGQRYSNMAGTEKRTSYHCHFGVGGRSWSIKGQSRLSAGAYSVGKTDELRGQVP